MFVESFAPILELREDLLSFFFRHKRIEPVPTVGKCFGPVFGFEEITVYFPVETEWFVFGKFLLKILNGSSADFPVIRDLVDESHCCEVMGSPVSFVSHLGIGFGQA